MKSLPRYLVKMIKSHFGPQIGRGMFSRVFKRENQDFVTIISKDKAKECAAIFSLSHPDFPKSEILFPKISFLDNCGRIDEKDKGINREIISKIENFAPDYNIYRMKYFPRVKSLKSRLKPLQWALYKELRGIMDRTGYFRDNWDRINNYRKLFLEMGENLNKSFPGGGIYGEIMNNAIDSLLNYGSSIRFEISPRNISVDSEGNLILLDVFFFQVDM